MCARAHLVQFSTPRADSCDTIGSFSPYSFCVRCWLCRHGPSRKPFIGITTWSRPRSWPRRPVGWCWSIFGRRAAGRAWHSNQNVFNQPGVANAIEAAVRAGEAQRGRELGDGAMVWDQPRADRRDRHAGWPMVGKLISPPTPAAYVAEVTAAAGKYTARSGQTYAKAAAAAPSSRSSMRRMRVCKFRQIRRCRRPVPAQQVDAAKSPRRFAATVPGQTYRRQFAAGTWQASSGRNGGCGHRRLWQRSTIQPPAMTPPPAQSRSRRCGRARRVPLAIADARSAMPYARDSPIATGREPIGVAFAGSAVGGFAADLAGRIHCRSRRRVRTVASGPPARLTSPHAALRLGDALQPSIADRRCPIRASCRRERRRWVSMVIAQ